MLHSKKEHKDLLPEMEFLSSRTAVKVNSSFVHSVLKECQKMTFKYRLHSAVFAVTLICTFYQFCFYKHSTCMALLCFNNLCVLNVFRVTCHLLGLWSEEQQPHCHNYSYGLARVRTLAIFSSLILMMMLACWSVKVMLMVFLGGGSTTDSIYNCYSRGNVLLFGVEVVALTGMVTATGSGVTLDSTIRASILSSSHSHIFHKLVKRLLPSSLKWTVLDAVSSLRRIWLRGPLCPVIALALSSWVLLILHTLTATLITSLYWKEVLEEQWEELGLWNSYYIVGNSALIVLWCDAVTALTILLLTASCLHQPLIITTRTLMQGVVFSSSSVQRSLHEAATIDGVLELKQAHVWCLAPFSSHSDRETSSSSNSETLVGSVLVRLQRDAEMSSVATDLKNCLKRSIHFLTLQVYKDDWLSAPSAKGNITSFAPSTNSPSPSLSISHAAKPVKSPHYVNIDLPLRPSDERSSFSVREKNAISLSSFEYSSAAAPLTYAPYPTSVPVYSVNSETNSLEKVYSVYSVNSETKSLTSEKVYSVYSANSETNSLRPIVNSETNSLSSEKVSEVRKKFQPAMVPRVVNDDDDHSYVNIDYSKPMNLL